MVLLSGLAIGRLGLSSRWWCFSRDGFSGPRLPDFLLGLWLPIPPLHYRASRTMYSDSSRPDPTLSRDVPVTAVKILPQQPLFGAVLYSVHLQIDRYFGEGYIRGVKEEVERITRGDRTCATIYNGAERIHSLVSESVEVDKMAQDQLV